MPELNLGRIKGADGAPGKDGKSAYQYAVDGGYKGTEDDFKRSMAEAPWLSLSGGKMEGPILPPEDHIFAKSKRECCYLYWRRKSRHRVLRYGSDDFCGMSSLSGSVKMVANNGGVESGRVEVSASNGVSNRGLTDPVSDTDAVNKKYGDAYIRPILKKRETQTDSQRLGKMVKFQTAKSKSISRLAALSFGPAQQTLSRQGGPSATVKTALRTYGTDL